ncbi:MAG TPA: lysoplasmalogenase [Chitinophagaceae bacterium]
MRPKTIFIIYAIVIVADLLLIILKQPDLRWFTKPLLLPLLMLAYYKGITGTKDRLFYLFMGGLFFSWTGDILLQAKNLFIPGLIAFLLAHLFYIFYFIYAIPGRIHSLKKQGLTVLIVLLYIIALLTLLYPYLGALRLPVIIYSLAIGIMLLMAIHIRGKLNPATAAYFITGAVLFVLSDSILAINLFILKQEMVGLAVMATYAAAQYFLVKGALSSNSSS